MVNQFRMVLASILVTTAVLPLPAFAGPSKVAIGFDYMLLLKSDGTVWSWGYNASGQLGTGNTDQANTPVQIVGLEGVVDIAASKYSGGFSMALKADGTVWVWGNLSDGRIGAPTSGGVYSRYPVQVPGLHNILTVAETFQGATAFAVNDEGKVWSWGYGTSGQLGDGQQTSQRGVPQVISNLNGIIQISGTNTQVIALEQSGNAFGWGWGTKDDNFLTGSTTDSVIPPLQMNVSALSFLEGVDSNIAGLFMGIDYNGSVLIWGDSASGLLTCYQNIGSASLESLPQPYYPSGLDNIQQIAGGGVYALFLKNDGSVLGCGENGWGQLGDGTTIDTVVSHNAQPSKYGPVYTVGLQDIIRIAAGFYASAAISFNGDVYTWGRADYGLSGTLNNQSAQMNLQPVKLDINAGPQLDAPPVFAGTQYGSLNDVTIDVGLAVSPIHIDANGEIYLAAIVPNLGMFLLDASYNWVPYDPNKPIPPLYQGNLPGLAPIHLIESSNLTGLDGTVVLVGYGLGTDANATADLLNNHRYSAVLTLH